MEDLNFKIFVAAVAVAVNGAILYGLWCVVRSLMKKPLNFAPSERKWARVFAEVIKEEYTEEVIEPEPEAFQDVKNRKSGKSRNTTPIVQNLRYYRVRYTYESCCYEAKIVGYTVKRKGAVIYCRKDNPEIAKEFIPVPPWTVETSIAALFVIALTIFFEIMVFM